MSPTTPRFGIRRYLSADIVPHFEAARESVADVYPWLPWCHPGYSVAESASWVLSRDYAWNMGIEYSFVVHHLATGILVGSVSLTVHGQPFGCANLGYWVRSRWHRQGAGTAAVRCAARFGFDVLRLQRLEILAAVGNIPSQRTAAKAGARREGVLRRRVLCHGRMHDAVVYSLIPEDLST